MESDSRLTRRGMLGLAGATALELASCAPTLADRLPRPRYILEWGTRGTANGEFNACIGIALGPHGDIYTSEFRNQRVQRFTQDGKFIEAFPIQPTPGGLAVDNKGNVYVGHWNNNKLAAYSPVGKLLFEWGVKGTGDGEVQLPGSLTLGPDGLLYVADQGNSRVHIFTTAGKYAGKFGSRGFEPGQFGGSQPIGGRFAGPQFIAFDRHGNIYTTDAALDRVQKFTPEGRIVCAWGSESAEPGGFGPKVNGLGGPIGICVDRKDRVWVGGTNSRVQQFTSAGEYLRGIGGLGSEPGRFHLPHGLIVDGRGHLYVSDTMNARIQKFAT